MKKTRKLLSIFLTVVLVALTMSCLSVVSFSAAPIGGTCGENIKWTFEDGVLTVTGTGVIERQNVIVDGEYLVTDHFDENGNHVESHYETGPHEVTMFPWETLVDDVVFAKYGTESMEELFAKVMYGAIDGGQAYLDYFTFVKKIVIGEGITGIDGSAFDMFRPQSIILPSTLSNEYSCDFDGTYLKELVIKNSTLNFENYKIQLMGFMGGTRYTSLEELLSEQVEMTNLQSFYGAIGAFAELAFDFAYMAKGKADAIAGIKANEEWTAEQKQQALDDIDRQEQQVLAGYAETFESMGIEAESLEEAAAALLARFNKLAGTSFASASELGTEEEANDYAFVPSDAVTAVLEAIAARVIDFYENMEDTGTFNLGEEFKKTDTVDGEAVTKTYKAAPWVTVYGAKNSTAQAACEVSGVKFVSFSDAKAEFGAAKDAAVAAAEAKAKDGDSDASKKLITDAKAAINATAYDESKTLSENKAVLDTILAKLDTDLAAQRAADANNGGKDDKNDDGGYSNNAFMKFIRKIIDFFKNLFSKIFK